MRRGLVESAFAGRPLAIGRLLPHGDGCGACGAVPCVSAVLADEAVGQVVEGLRLARLHRVSRKGVENGVASRREHAGVGEASGHVPVDAAAGVSCLDSCSVQAGNGCLVVVDDSVEAVHHNASVDARHAHVSLDAVEGRRVHGHQMVAWHAEVVVAALGAHLVVALDGRNAGFHGNACCLAQLL